MQDPANAAIPVNDPELELTGDPLVDYIEPVVGGLFGIVGMSSRPTPADFELMLP